MWRIWGGWGGGVVFFCTGKWSKSPSVDCSTSSRQGFCWVCIGSFNRISAPLTETLLGSYIDLLLEP